MKIILSTVVSIFTTDFYHVGRNSCFWKFSGNTVEYFLKFLNETQKIYMICLLLTMLIDILMVNNEILFESTLSILKLNGSLRSSSFISYLYTYDRTCIHSCENTHNIIDVSIYAEHQVLVISFFSFFLLCLDLFITFFI